MITISLYRLRKYGDTEGYSIVSRLYRLKDKPNHIDAEIGDEVIIEFKSGLNVLLPRYAIKHNGRWI